MDESYWKDDHPIWLVNPDLSRYQARLTASPRPGVIIPLSVNPDWTPSVDLESTPATHILWQRHERTKSCQKKTAKTSRSGWSSRMCFNPADEARMQSKVMFLTVTRTIKLWAYDLFRDHLRGIPHSKIIPSAARAVPPVAIRGSSR